MTQQKTIFFLFINLYLLIIFLLYKGLLAGLVAITGGCAYVEPWASIIIGIVASLLYLLTSKLLIRLHIDDPLDAFAVHGIGGFWVSISKFLFLFFIFLQKQFCFFFFFLIVIIFFKNKNKK